MAAFALILALDQLCACTHIVSRASLPYAITLATRVFLPAMFFSAMCESMTTTGVQPLIIECQGRIVHDDADSAVSDGNRVVALQHMGYEVMLLSYEQIAQSDRFEVVKRLIARYLGIKYRRKTKGLQHLEHELRRKIFIDWSTIAA